jgi:hypothetical protein
MNQSNRKTLSSSYRPFSEIRILNNDVLVWVKSKTNTLELARWKSKCHDQLLLEICRHFLTKFLKELEILRLLHNHLTCRVVGSRPQIKPFKLNLEKVEISAVTWPPQVMPLYRTTERIWMCQSILIQLHKIPQEWTYHKSFITISPTFRFSLKT